MPTDPNAKPTAVRNLRGPVSDLPAKLDDDHALSPELNAYLKAKLAACPHGGVTVNAHELQSGGDFHISISITKLFLALLVPLLMLASTGHGAITSSNLVTYAATGGASTNTGTAVLIGTAYVNTAPNFIISDGGTASTNALTVEIQYGLDTSNFTTQATYTKPTTNATEGIVSPGVLSVRIYARTRIVTTNNVSVGTKAVFTQ